MSNSSMAAVPIEDHSLVAVAPNGINSPPGSSSKPKPKVREKNKESSSAVKRRCVSTACIACRRRKSKCDGNTPSCAACSSVYGTECVYDPNSDHRRKGVYKKDIDNLKTRNSTLQTLIHAILNYPEHEVPALIREIRTCESLDDVAESITSRESATRDDKFDGESPMNENDILPGMPKFEAELSGKMGELRLDNGSVSFIGGTSNLLYLGSNCDGEDFVTEVEEVKQYKRPEDAIVSWTEVPVDPELVVHLINMYFTWHYTYFTTLSKSLFYSDFLQGKPNQETKRKTEYCTSLLVNAMLALGCHFTSWPTAREVHQNSATAGDHFFREAKRLILQNDEHEHPKLATVQALALMSVREAGCGREGKGWVYSGMSFRMAYDLGLNVDSGTSTLDEQEVDARRVTIWGCFLFDKCWSNYLGRQPQLPLSSISVPKFDVFPVEDADIWSPYMDSGVGQAHSQPSRTRAVALQISALCEISCDLLLYFYNPTRLEKPMGRQTELKRLGELHTRLEDWRKNLPKEMDHREGQLPNVLVMHMFFQLLFIHLFRPFLKYKQSHSPLPAHVSPRKFCTHAASMISKLLRLYKKTHGMRQICNIAVYIAHSACTIHLLNLPDKNAARDIVHGLKHLEEIAESWLCARRTLGILDTVARRWKTELPEEAVKILQRTDIKFGIHKHDHGSPRSDSTASFPSQLTPRYQNMGNLSPSYTTPNYGLFNSSPARMSPAIVPETSQIGRTLSVPLQPASDLSQTSQEQSYVLHEAEQELWDQGANFQVPISHVPVSQAPVSRSQSSPSTLFGGVESLVKESQDWWLKDQAQFFDSWYDPEQGQPFMGNNVINDLGIPQYGAGSYGLNGEANVMPANPSI